MSKAVSQYFGISKKAALTIVRMPRPVPNAEEIIEGIQTGVPLRTLRYNPLINGMIKIFDQLNPRGKEGQSQRNIVVNIALGWEIIAGTLPNYPPKPGDDEFALYSIVKRMTDQGVIFVTAAGNEGAPTFSNVCLNNYIHVQC